MVTFEYDAFLSYSSRDKAAVRALAKRLQAKGLRVWFDEWVIKTGDDIYLAIERGLETSRCLVLCLSQTGVSSEWVRLERSTVLFRDPGNQARRFVPLLLEECKLPDALRRYKYVDYRERSKRAFNELLLSLQSVAGEPTAAGGFRDAADSDMLDALVRARKNEWRRLRSDFESASRLYHDVEMKVFFVTKEGAYPNETFRRPNHVINLWQFYGVAGEAETHERIKSMQLTKFGLSGAELTAFAVLLGEQTDLFCKVARRAGTLIGDEINRLITSELSMRIEEDLKPGKPIFATNSNELAKWLNLVLVITQTFLPQRFHNNRLQVDPFAASLAVFDFLPLDDE